MPLRIFSEAGPVEIGGEQTGRLFDLIMSPGESAMYLRFIALFRDNRPLRGEAPTFQIQAPGGFFASVGPTSGRVEILGVQDNVVASVTCTRDSNDVFLLAISDIAENSGRTWQMRIRNNDPESLRFLGFASNIADETLQPWLVLPEPDNVENGIAVGQELLTPQELASGGRAYDVPFFRVEQNSESKRTIEVRNWGTKRLTFSESLGPLGENPGFTLEACPAFIDPHGAKELIVSTNADLLTDDVVHLLRCNDGVKKHGRLGFKATTNAGSYTPPVSPPSESFCRRGCGCQEYAPTAADGQGACSCGHSKADHEPR